MTQDEAEKLARKLLPADFNPSDYFLPRITVGDVRALCNHILSGSMKREIENAAFERAAKQADEIICHPAFDKSEQNTARIIFNSIRSLIQPPAQKENGE